MTESIGPVRFFLGANSPHGFVSRFDQLECIKDNWNTHIIKGGPGTGKSSLMKKIAQALDNKGEYIEEIYCSSDAGSLDAVIMHSKRASIADGTPPHVIEPKYPGAYDTVINLSETWDGEKLREHRAEIQRLFHEISELHTQSTRFLAAFEALMGDNRRIAASHTDTAKIKGYAKRLAAREFGVKNISGGGGLEAIRFLSAITDRGVVLMEDTVKALAKRVYIIDDEHGAAGPELLLELRTLALAMGLSVISCYCPTLPDKKLEHLIINELSLAFVTQNRAHQFSLEPYRIVHARRFTDSEGLKKFKQRLSFNRRAAYEMLGQSLSCLSEAKRLHDALEGYYMAAMDFESLDSLSESILNEIISH